MILDLLSCAGIGIPEDPALLVGAAILTSPVYTKAILSIGFLYLGYRGCIALALWSSCAHMTGLVFVPNAIIYAEVCVTRGNKPMFLNRLDRPDLVGESFDDSDFPQQSGGTSPQLLQDFVLQGFCKWKLRLLQVTLHCVAWSADRQRTFCLHRALKGIGHKSCAFSRGYPRPCYTTQNVKYPDELCRDPCRASLTSPCCVATLVAHHRASHSSRSPPSVLRLINLFALLWHLRPEPTQSCDCSNKAPQRQQHSLAYLFFSNAPFRCE